MFLPSFPLVSLVVIKHAPVVQEQQFHRPVQNLRRLRLHNHEQREVGMQYRRMLCVELSQVSANEPRTLLKGGT